VIWLNWNFQTDYVKIELKKSVMIHFSDVIEKCHQNVITSFFQFWGSFQPKFLATPVFQLYNKLVS